MSEQAEKQEASEGKPLANDADPGGERQKLIQDIMRRAWRLSPAKAAALIGRVEMMARD